MMAEMIALFAALVLGAILVTLPNDVDPRIQWLALLGALSSALVFFMLVLGTLAQ